MEDEEDVMGSEQKTFQYEMNLFVFVSTHDY